MRFIDEATIEVVAGHGGAGRVSFRRESKVAVVDPMAVIGRGGDVIAWADPNTTTLLDHRYKRWYRAPAGEQGGKSQASGAAGEDLVIPLPPGTVITDQSTGDVIADLVEPDARIVLAKGGRGGRGNAFFTTSTRQAPRFAQDGEAGESFTLDLSLKLVADVGIVGLPNAGKSTFIRKVSRSQARVADYPFTTLVPNLGVARVDDRVLVIADIPGLVEGASEGHGLGDRFLKHVERNRALIISASPGTPRSPGADHREGAGGPLSWPPSDSRNRLEQDRSVDDRYGLDLWRQAFGDRGVSILVSGALTGEDVFPSSARSFAYLTLRILRIPRTMILVPDLARASTQIRPRERAKKNPL